MGAQNSYGTVAFMVKYALRPVRPVGVLAIAIPSIPARNLSLKRIIIPLEPTNGYL